MVKCHCLFKWISIVPHFYLVELPLSFGNILCIMALSTEHFAIAINLLALMFSVVIRYLIASTK